MMEGKSEKVLRKSSCSEILSQNMVDRISDLPDPILSHILSLLHTKNAVATSILSQRWKFLWRTVSNYHFSNIDKLDPIVYSDDEDNSDIDWELRDRQIEANLVKFVEFVNNVLLLRTPGSIDRFSLVWEAQSISSDVNSWINIAIANNVQELVLSIYVGNLALMFEPPSKIFSCESLHSLHLKCNFLISPSNVFCLPKVETLQLESIRFDDEEAFQKLLLGCPMLKCLYISTYFVIDHGDLDDIEEEDMFKFIVHSNSLKSLRINVRGNLPDLCYCSLDLETPSLKYLNLQGYICRIFLQGSLSSLNEVEFRIKETVIGGHELSEDSCDYVVEALRAFSCAKVLNLSNQVMRAIGFAGMCLSTKFKRLTNLTMMADDSIIWLSIQDTMDFIQCLDNLQVLTFDKGCHYFEGDMSENPDQVPECLRNSLKMVSFHEFEGYQDEVTMVEYLLKHGSVLEMVYIHCKVKPSYRDPKTKYELLQQISRFSRKSPACELLFF